MKKVVNITTGGIVFTIEEDAYVELSKYLESIRGHFSDLEERNEIVNDIELGIAEKLNRHKKGKVITTADITAIVAEMGTIADFQEVGIGSNEKQTENETNEKSHKRLYRNIDDQVIGGVASGLAAYFNVDPVLVRVLFVLSIFLNGFGLLAYLVLWITMPAAESVAQKLEMKGNPVTLYQFEKVQKSKTVADTSPSNSVFKKIIKIPFTLLKGFMNGVRAILGGVAPVLRFVLGGALLIGSVVAMIAITVGVNIAHVSFNSDVLNVPLHTFLTGVQYVIGLVSVYLLFLIPATIGAIGAWSILKRENKFKTLLVSIFAVIWLGAIFGVGYVASNLVPKYQEYRANIAEVTEIHELEEFKGVAVYSGDNVSVKKGEQYSVLFKGKEDVVALRTYEVHNGILTINNKNEDKICIDCFAGVDVVITIPELISIEAAHSTDIITDEFITDSFAAKFIHSSTGEINIKAEQATLDISHSSDVVVTGNVKELVAQIKYSSTLDTKSLINSKSSLTLNHSSDAMVGETETLYVSAQASSDVQYMGEPELTSDVSESSEVRPLF